MRLHHLIDMAGSRCADLAWRAVRAIHRRIPYRPFHPAWSPAPLPKRDGRSRPPLGLPRETDSLCPRCVVEVRDAIVAGERELECLIEGHPGRIPATIAERDGRVIIEKECPRHGRFEDVLSTDPKLFLRLEERFPGRDVPLAPDRLHRHGPSTIRYGRGAVLTIDLTNRCNMMCNPCFVDANQVGYVHQLGFDDIKKILDDAITVRPRRQLSVQFAGGEPTLSPHFLDAIRYAKGLGYFSIQVATNGVRFAQDPGLARRAREAGLKFAYLQFDGVGEEANHHRGVGNLFAIKEAAIRNLHEAGVTVALVMTIVGGVNDDQFGRVYDFTMRNIEAIHTIAFQPISFTGRDEGIDDARRAAQRYTIGQLAHDFKAQTGLSEPIRDWYPLSAAGPLSDLADVIRGREASWGSFKCGCHPDCGAGMMIMVNMTTKESVPVPAFLRVDRLMGDLEEIASWARGSTWTKVLAGLAFYRNFRPRRAPTGMRFLDLLRQVDSHTGGHITGNRRKRFRWGLLTVAAMWFQDLWTYDFRRTEMCVIPYGTQMGEISFCAYNTGVGWRKIVEKMHRTATVAEWHREIGRSPVYAKGRSAPLGQEEVPSEEPGPLPTTPDPAPANPTPATSR